MTDLGTTIFYLGLIIIAIFFVILVFWEKFFYFNRMDTSLVEVQTLKIPLDDIVVNARLYLPKQQNNFNSIPNGLLPLILYNHGWAMNFKLPQITMWGYAIAGTGRYACLLYECRGHGKTTGKKNLGLIFKDIPKIIDYATTLPNIDPNRMGFAGISMGGEIALTKAFEDPRIKATVAMCSPHNAKANFGRIPKNIKEKIILAYMHNTGVNPKHISEEMNQYISPEFVFPTRPENYREKVFLIHAKNDPIVAFEQALQNQQVLGLPDSQTLFLEKGGHTFMHQELLISGKMLAFFDKKV